MHPERRFDPILFNSARTQSQYTHSVDAGGNIVNGVRMLRHRINLCSRARHSKREALINAILKLFPRMTPEKKLLPQMALWMVAWIIISIRHPVNRSAVLASFDRGFISNLCILFSFDARSVAPR